MHCFLDASFPGNGVAHSGGTGPPGKATEPLMSWECARQPGEEKKPSNLLLIVGLKMDYSGPAQVAMALKAIKGPEKKFHVHFREFLLSEQKSHEFYSGF